jgi:pimeloyl-ACP methyl ester carboxylesterase
MHYPFGRASWIAFIVLIACSGDDAPPASPALASHRIDTVSSANRADIVYEVHGDSADKPALVLVHCWSCDRGYWYAQIDDLSKDYRLAAIDLAGHGDSYPGDRNDFTTDGFAGDVAAVVGDLGWDRVVLVGHSMGGGVIVEAASQLPGKVRGLVWVDAFHRIGGSEAPPEEMDAFFAPFDSNFVEQTRTFVRSLFPTTADSATMNRVALDMSAAPPAVAMSAMRNAFRYDARLAARLTELNLPVVAINADLFPTDSASMAEHGVQVITMPEVGHFLQMEDPARFNTLLRDALGRIPQ